MAKSKEEKLADTLINALSDTRFRKARFSDILVEDSPTHIRREVLSLMISYLKFISIYDKHGYYPNGIEEEAKIATHIINSLESSDFLLT